MLMLLSSIHGPINSYHSFDEQFDTFPIQCRHIENMNEGVWFRKKKNDKITAVRT